MLILAGVSINAIVGDNGVLTQTQYASFLNEMAMVEEAVQMWQTGEIIDAKGKDNRAIPTNGLCQSDDLEKTERLVGEVGYYRTWSMGETIPEMNILTSAEDFNGKFEAELIMFPAGVQDLFYLNNEAIGIDSDRAYLIDAATSMIYSMNGVSLKGIRCYSSNMAKAVMSGINDTPLFVEAEVSGTGNGEILAGNVQYEYLPDGTKNPDYNPNGFQIIASPNSNNIFKLYNNGELYGKGTKGIQLNTKIDEMEKINANVWCDFDILDNFDNYKNAIIAFGSIYLIDENEDLWVYGSNSSNKLGLTDEQQKEYTGRDFIKVDLNGEKVSKIFPCVSQTFLVTKSNKLLAAGGNVNGQLGAGNTTTTVKFVEVSFGDGEEGPLNIIDIKNGGNTGNVGSGTVIRTESNKFYFAGTNGTGIIGNGKSGDIYLNFTRIWGGDIDTPDRGPDIDQDIKDFVLNMGVFILKNNGELWCSGNCNDVFQAEVSCTTSFQRYGSLTYDMIKGNDGSDGCSIAFRGTDGKLYASGGRTSWGSKYGQMFNPTEIEMPNGYTANDIKDILFTTDSTLLLFNDNSVYGIGNKNLLGLNEKNGELENFEKIKIDDVQSFSNNKITIMQHARINFITTSNGMFCTGNQNLIFGDNILQKTWSLVATNVKYFTANGNAYIDRNNNLWVAGENSYHLGLGEISQNNEPVLNYVKVTDPLIAGKAVDYYFSNQNLYVLTNEGILYGTGNYSSHENYGKPGWTEEQNYFNFIQIETDVDKLIETHINDYASKTILKNDGKVYTWGRHYAGSIGQSSNITYNTPTATTINGLPCNVNELREFFHISSFRSFALTNSGETYISGNWYHMWAGGQNTEYGFKKYEWLSDKNIISVASNNVYSAIFLDNNGKIYGYGEEKNIGEGYGTNRVAIKQLGANTGLANKKITQILAGNGFYIAVTEDGQVWGTGTNTNGILGRWIGVDRSTTNSRYKTAGEWVECPELEI